jgi:hypothetical protein
MDGVSDPDPNVLKIPGALAIAHHLIRAWLDGHVRWD